MTRKTTKDSAQPKTPTPLGVNKQTVKNLSVSGKEVQGGMAPKGTYTKVSVCAEQCC